MNFNSLQEKLFNWLMRRTTNNAVRRLAELPIAIATDIGLTRSENQDKVAVLRIQLTENRLLVIAVLCDGMGGMTDGRECACLAISHFLSSCVQNTNSPLQERIIVAVENANNAIFKKYTGIGGSTLSSFIADSKYGLIAVNVGDSRIYSIHNNQILQLTVDDTISGQLAKNNKNFYRNNELLQYIGMGKAIEPNIINFSTDTVLTDILLTSDGVHFMNKDTMKAIITHSTDYALTIKRLTELAKWHGGYDNASAIIVTKPLSLLESKSNFDPKMVEVWDAFGEIQFISDTISQSDQPEEKKVVLKKTTRSQKKIHFNSELIASPQKRKPKTVKNQIEKDVVVPELQINFGLNEE
jgi:serine/threonine protein phosphatase PrpC